MSVARTREHVPTLRQSQRSHCSGKASKPIPEPMGASSLPDCIFSQKDHTKKKLLGILLGFEANVTQQASVAKEAIVRNVAQATVDSDASDLEHTVSYYNKLGNYERFRHIRLANHRRCHRLSCFAYWEYRHHKR